MDCKKPLLLMCLILVFAISGCGRKEEAATKQEAARIEQREVEKEAPVAGGPVVKAQLPMVEPEKEVVLAEGEILVADFEGWPNNLGGEMGVYGALEPDWEQIKLYPVSWVYEATSLGYNPSNVHSGMNSFRLVNALGVKRDLVWGSFAMDLGPTTDLTVVPKKVVSLDVSGYKYLTFWAKGEKGGEKTELLVRDAHALNYNPQIKYKLPDLTTEWQKIVVTLEEFGGKVDLTQLDNIGIGFGKDVGNMEGDIAYIDDFTFTNKP